MAPYFVIILYDILCEPPDPHGARGDVCAGNLSTTSRDHLFEKPLHVGTVTKVYCMSMSCLHCYGFPTNGPHL
jgi:hypothetical protein